MNSIKSWNLKKYLDLGVWGLETTFGSLGSRRCIEPRTLAVIFTNRTWFFQNHEMNPIKSWNLKKCLDLGGWGLETTFGPLGPKRHIQPLVQNPSFNFHKQDLIFSKLMRWIQLYHEILKNHALGKDRFWQLVYLNPSNLYQYNINNFVNIVCTDTCKAD